MFGNSFLCQQCANLRAYNLKIDVTDNKYTTTLFWPEQKLSKLFSYLKNSFNTATLFWPVGDRINGVQSTVPPFVDPCLACPFLDDYYTKEWF